MITDKETNKVYFSSILQTDRKYKEAFNRIKYILIKHNINYSLLTNTKDIWCRDYMPIQTDENKFIQFRYEPSYLENELNLQSNPKGVLASNGITSEFSNINLDGGNVVNSENKVILTRRIFKENPQLSPTEVETELRKLFKSDVYFVQDITSDLTGHIDGHLRFIDSKTVLVNELENERDYWTKCFLKMVSKANFEFFEMPWFETDDKDSAIGIYVNYLEIGELILFPIFEIKGNKDKEAIVMIKKVFPNRIIKPININEIAKHGGLLNCITWTIKK